MLVNRNPSASPEFTSLEFPSRGAPRIHPSFSRVTLG